MLSLNYRLQGLKNFFYEITMGIGAVVRNIAQGALGSGFDSRAAYIGHSVANGSLPLQRFFRVVLPGCQVAELGPATCYTRRRYKASSHFFDNLNQIDLKSMAKLNCVHKIVKTAAYHFAS